MKKCYNPNSRQRAKRAFIYLQRQRAKPKLAKKSFIKSRIFKRQTNTPCTRGTFTTIMNELRDQHGLDFDIIDKCLAHGETSKTIASYNHAELLKHRRKALQFWADRLATIIGRGMKSLLRTSSHRAVNFDFTHGKFLGAILGKNSPKKYFF